MLEGEIIKYYRRKRKMNQEDLCEGICSVSHLSKIEVGSTKYSDELLPLLEKRLGIDIKEKVKKYNQLKMNLEEWRQAILFQKKDDIDRLKKSLESEELIGIPSMFLNYKFLLSRYFLYAGELDSAYKTITGIEKESFDRLSLHESNYLQYLYGIYYFKIGLYNDSIEALESIESDHDEPGEYYYYLALSNHAIDSSVKSYHMAAEALKIFVKELNLSRIVDAEMLMLIQLNITDSSGFHSTIKKYHRLIEICERNKDDERKGQLCINLAFEYARSGYYIEASELYKEVLELAEDDELYIASLEGYIISCLHGKLLPKKELIRLCKKGQRLSENIDDVSYRVFFGLHLLSVENDEVKYYQYIENTLIPNFRKTGYRLILEHYEKKLFYYLLRQKRDEDALSLAKHIIDQKKTFYRGEPEF